MEKTINEVEVLCKQFFIEGNKDLNVAYNLMCLEYSLISDSMPVKDIREFEGYLR